MDIETYLARNPKHKEAFDLMPIEKQKQCIEAFNNVALVVDALLPTIKKLAQQYAVIAKKVISAYPNKRVVHLALHGKKKRTRKKNMHRILKDVQKWKRRENGEE